MQRNLRLSHTVVDSIRRTMDTLGFVDVWTPSMTKGTPEGARDFLVPVRLQPRRFFALAQSPQIFKQLCVIGGIDRYYQIATCWRDEDLRADRQFEFRQLDLEMAFVEREDVLDVLEQSVVGAFEALGREPPTRPFPRMTFAEALSAVWHGQAGSPLRPRDRGRDRGHPRLGIRGLRERTGRAISGRAASVLSRRARRGSRRSPRSGGRRVSRTSSTEDGEVRSPIAKFLSDQELEAFRSEPGTTVLFAAGDQATVERVLGGSGSTSAESCSWRPRETSTSAG